ncbi:protein RRP5 homolog [Pecten maximus]|uniref:protein RRP5 homolog n=1 Tax=Pecten maximus TaxID=6579 RepID=UPI001457F9AD|nr:protein RRP5 homolog [Pecten maximus]
MEENFPRGGSSKRVKKDSAPVKVDDEDLFHSEESATPNKKRKKEFGKENVAKKVKVTPKNDISEKIVERTCALKKNMVSNGMLLMGSVTKVEDYSLCVGLPNGLSGSVQITHISDAYTQLLQKLTEASSSESANALDVPSLHEMFRVGQLLPCRVFETSAFKKKHNFKLTINPREINEGMVASHIKNGMVLNGCIQSLEDHGYVVDIGISGTRAFLNHSDAEKFNNGESLHVGEAVRCLVTTEGDGSEDVGESLRVVKVSIDPKKVSKSQLGSSVRLPLTWNTKFSLSLYLPGFAFRVARKIFGPSLQRGYPYECNCAQSGLMLEFFFPGDGKKLSVMYCKQIHEKGVREITNAAGFIPNLPC